MMCCYFKFRIIVWAYVSFNSKIKIVIIHYNVMIHLNLWTCFLIVQLLVWMNMTNNLQLSILSCLLFYLLRRNVWKHYNKAVTYWSPHKKSQNTVVVCEILEGLEQWRTAGGTTICVVSGCDLQCVSKLWSITLFS